MKKTARKLSEIAVSMTSVATFVAWVAPAIAADDVVAQVVSTKPDMVTGEEALVELRGVSVPSSMSVLLNGRSAGRAIRANKWGDKLIVHVEGLKVGMNHLVFHKGHSTLAKLEIVDHPITGPVFSGPQQQPFICQTEAAGLGAPHDAACSAKTRIEYLYKSTQPPPQEASPETADPARLPTGFKLLDLYAPRPADIAQTKTSEGRVVNFIVRRERGTINRAIYEISFLHEPGTPLPDPWSRSSGWNGRLIYKFGGGCRAGYHQGEISDTSNYSYDVFLARGYAVALSSLNVFDNNCNDVISAETAMMVKEHFIDRFGIPLYTIGVGGSGGSMQVYLIAQNYPGILDGIIPSWSYPDITTTMFDADCSLLDHALSSSHGNWADEQKTAIVGFASWNTCKALINEAGYSPGWLKATSTAAPAHAWYESCDSSIPHDLIYEAQKNPAGARCGVYDTEVNSYGRDTATGFARRPFDNVGVQYGLLAFDDGTITAEQFVELNELVGGYDRDGNIVASRSAADLEALQIAYGKGRVNTGSGALGTIPIIDWRNYVDFESGATGFHDRIRSLITRARLVAANGRADNQVIITIPGSKPGEVLDLGPMDAEVLVKMEEWLDAVLKDKSHDPAIEKVVRAKPRDLNDACVTDTGSKIVEQASFDSERPCNKLYPPHTTTRMAAGGPLSNDVLKCALKPLDPGSYGHALSESQIERLRTVFKDGVCDYTRPGVAQGTVSQTWLRY